MSEQVKIERDIFGALHIFVGEFDLVQVQYQHPVTDNASTRLLAERIVRIISGTDDYANLQAERERYKSAFYEWHDKTEWVQKTATAKELGKHRADVLRERIESLQAEYRRVRDNQNTLIARVRRLENELAAIKAQEPVAWSLKLPDGRVTLEKAYPSWIDDGSFGATDAYIATPLYTLPTTNQQLTAK